MNIDWRDFTYNCQGSSTQSSRWGAGWITRDLCSPLEPGCSGGDVAGDSESVHGTLVDRMEEAGIP